MITGKAISQYTSYSLIFSLLRSVITENSMKSISTINPTITENMECTIVKACAPVIGIRVGVSP